MSSSAQPSLFALEPTHYSVSQLTARIKTLLEQDVLLQSVWVEGEVSNFTRAGSGHLYFTLKDAGAQLACVMWRSQAQRLRYLPKDGERLFVHGAIGVYEASGKYQLYADFLQPAGRGALSLEFERLKARLEAEGLFAAERKRPLPSFPQRIGLVTSRDAAALRDVLQTLRRRYPLIEVLFAPSAVQGEEAPPQLVAALRLLYTQPVDVILLVRGGGSLEDLWAFNDERVVRAVAASPVPLVSGVGHETDFTLCDFAADQRAPTPTAAAELVTPDRGELAVWLLDRGARLEQAWQRMLQQKWQALERADRHLRLLSPQRQQERARQWLDELSERQERAIGQQLARRREQVMALAQRLEALNPRAVLRRGYTLVRDAQTQRPMTSITQAATGQQVRLVWHDGVAAAEIVHLDEPESTGG